MAEGPQEIWFKWQQAEAAGDREQAEHWLSLLVGPASTAASSSAAAAQYASDSDEALSDAIDGLTQRIQAIEQSLSTLSGPPSPRGALVPFAAELSRIGEELSAIKTEVLPHLTNSRQALSQVQAFIRDYSTFLIASVEVRGTIAALQSQVTSFSTRLEAVEAAAHRAWQNRATIASILVAIVATATTIYVAFFRR